MPSTDKPIKYVVDSTALDIAVDVSNQMTGTDTQKSLRPWLTICLEPISHTLLTFVLSLEPPGPKVIKSLLYQVFQLSLAYPNGRRPDILQVDHAFLFAALQNQGLLQQLRIAIERPSFQYRSSIERPFGVLRISLQTHFPAFSNVGNEIEGNTSLSSLPHISLSQLENACAQWAESYSQLFQDQEQREFFDYCQTRWQLSPVYHHELDLLLTSDL